MKNRGFTLVELAIVIVIIGLVVGGVLVGKDLIAASKVRSSIAQLQSYDVAKNTFKDKFGGEMPGDSGRLDQYGFTVGNRTEGQSDSDGKLEACASDDARLGCEIVLFFMHLSQANMINFNPVFSGSGGANNRVNYNTDTLTDYIAELDIGAYAFPVTFASMGDSKNYYMIASPGTGAVDVRFDALTPMQAFAIDRKMDDGMPVSGGVVASWGPTTTNPGLRAELASDTGAFGDCTNGALATSRYNVDENNPGESEVTACKLNVRMQ